MKILLLGAKGMLGQALQAEFASEELTAWDREELDITDRKDVLEKVDAIRSTFAKTSADKQAHDFVIINAAAYTAVDEAETNHEAAFLVNEIGVRNVADAAKEVGATVVHYSTDYVFAGTAEEGYAEDDVPGPAVNVYGESKLAGEKALQDSGARYFLIRTAWLYGAGGKNFVDTMLKLADEVEELNVVNDQHGAPTYTGDVARATRHLLTGTTFSPGVYHAVNAGVATWYDVAVTIMQLAQIATAVVPVTSALYVRPARRPVFSVLQNTRGPIMPDWQESLKQYIKERK